MWLCDLFRKAETFKYLGSLKARYDFWVVKELNNGLECQLLFPEDECPINHLALILPISSSCLIIHSEVFVHLFCLIVRIDETLYQYSWILYPRDREKRTSKHMKCLLCVNCENKQPNVHTHTHTQTKHNKSQVGDNGTEDLNGAMGQML